MSFFGGGGGFNDPLFGDMHRIMHRQMRDMENLMDSMMFDPFSMMGGVGGGRGRGGGQPIMHPMIAGHHHSGHQLEDPRASMMMMNPFGAFGGGGLFGGGVGIGGMMQQMQQLQHQAVVNDPNAHVYTQSTVVSVAPGEDGRPEVYEATDSVRKAGDVKETRRSVRDTARGEERLSIGHHIGDRGHVIEKRRDRNNGGRIHEQQEFIGLDEDEAETFDEEWGRATRQAASGGRQRIDQGGGTSNSGAGGGRKTNSNLAIQAGSDSDRIYRTASPHGTHRARVATSDPARRHSPYHHHTPTRRRIVRVEEPPEDDQPPEQHKQTSEQHKKDAKSSGGPIIEEIE